MAGRSGDDDRLVEVAVAPNEIMARLWSGWLEADGITTMVKATGPGFAYFTNFANEHLIFVHQSDAERALEILREATLGDDEPDGS